ncbi:hypothetical protein N7455_000271 [Penicillium solitum]|uniref:uncharacterized protein n=1 Tax=Penicillium solitum TaxID=60172 RepID=UPI0032C3E83C|nr:hypothetical protein N7455_000271 [Penicillium solitum]
MASTRVSNLVCVKCKLRKRKCDKERPRCGYCTRKNLNCQYPSVDTKYLTVRPFLAVSSPIIRSSMLLSDTLSDVLQYEPANLNSTLYLQIIRIIRLADQSVDDISMRYFRGIHTFIPVISPCRFHQEVLHSSTLPSATFSLLLLSMCLITYHPGLAESSSAIDHATLYLTTKSLYTQIQSSFPPSLHLIQAGIIIASYEYATKKINDAFASIAVCARMGYAARLHLINLVEGLDPMEYLQAEEQLSTWWGIVITERTIFCEVDTVHQPLISRCPDKGLRLPKTMSQKWNPAPSPEALTPEGDSLGPSFVESDGYTSVTQAAWLLDQVFKSLEEQDIDSRLVQLDRLDHALQTSLALTMEQSQGRWGLFCTANAIMIRALYIIHRHVIDLTAEMAPSREKYPDQWRDSSYIALETITQMTQDIATTQNDMSLEEMDALPPSRAFVLRAALRYLDDLGVKRNRWDAARDQLKESLRMFDERWNVSLE